MKEPGLPFGVHMADWSSLSLISLECILIKDQKLQTKCSFEDEQCTMLVHRALGKAA